MRGIFRSKGFVISAILLTAWLVLSLFQFRSLPAGVPRPPSFFSSFNRGFSIDEEKILDVRNQLESERRTLLQREEKLNQFLQNLNVNNLNSVPSTSSIFLPTSSSSTISSSSPSSTQQQQGVIRWDPLLMEYRIEMTTMKKSSSYKLLIVVLTSLEHFEERELLRNRWKMFLSNPITLFDVTTGKNITTFIRDQVKIRFLMGDPRLGVDDGRERGRPTPAIDPDEDSEDADDEEDDTNIQRRRRRAQEERERKEKEERLRLEEEAESKKSESSTLSLSVRQLMERLHKEQETNGDLIAIRALADGYYLLAERVASIVSILSDLDRSVDLSYPWPSPTNLASSFGELKGFQHLMKVDDDSYVRLERMLKLLETLPSKELYWGMFHHASKVEIDTKARWYNPEYVTLNPVYPNYAAGGAYLLSRDLVEWIGRSSVPMKVWKGGPEDSQIGTWLSVLDIHRSESGGSRLWNYRCANCDCDDERVVAIHGFDKEALTGCFEAETNEKDICKCPTIQRRIADASRKTRVIRTTSRRDVATGKTSGGTGGGGSQVWMLILIGLGSFFGCAIFGGCLIYIFILVHREVQKLRKLEKLEGGDEEDEEEEEDEDEEEEEQLQRIRRLDGFGFGGGSDSDNSSASDYD